MIVLGLLLIVLAGAALVVVANDESGGIAASITALGRTVNLSKLELFLAGAATAAIFLIGLVLLSGGMRRSGVKRKKARAAKAETRDRVARLEEEKRQLERKLEAESAATPVATAEEPVGRHANVDDREEALRRDEPVGAATQPSPAIPAQDGDQLVAGTRARRDPGV